MGRLRRCGDGSGAVHSQTRSGEGWGAKNTKPSRCGLVLSLPCQTAMVGDAGWCWCVSLEVVVVVDVAFANASGRRGLGAKNPKPSRCGLVPSLPCQTAMVGGAEWCWCVSLEVVVAADVAFTNTSGGRWLEAKNPKPSRCGLVPSLPCQTVMVGGAGW